MATVVDYRTVLDNSRYFAGINGKGGHIPGYRGHTPQLRYSFGKTYGHQTQELETARHRGSVPISPWQIKSGTTNYQYPNASDARQEPVSMPATSRVEYSSYDRTPIDNNTGDSSRYTRNMIPGYTGYIPRWPFKFGSTYKRECDNCLDEFGNMQYQKQLATARSMNETPRNQAASLADGPQLSNYLNNLHRTSEGQKSVNDPPIPGYQGYIPRVHVSDVGLGERFHAMAKSGYEALYTEREKQEQRTGWNQNQGDYEQFTYRQ